MTTHTPPAARRRNAHLIATCARLTADIGQAAADVYEPIAEAPDEPVVVSGRALYLLSSSASARLDSAVARDQAQWLVDAQVEAEASTRAHRARVVLADLSEIVDTESAPTDVDAHPAVVELTAHQVAALAPAEAVHVLLDEDEVTPERVAAVAADYEVPAAELLDAALAQHTSTACLILTAAGKRAPHDPALAAEIALTACEHLAAAVRIASLDA